MRLLTSYDWMFCMFYPHLLHFSIISFPRDIRGLFMDICTTLKVDRYLTNLELPYVSVWANDIIEKIINIYIYIGAVNSKEYLLNFYYKIEAQYKICIFQCNILVQHNSLYFEFSISSSKSHTKWKKSILFTSKFLLVTTLRDTFITSTSNFPYPIFSTRRTPLSLLLIVKHPLNIF